MTRRPTDPAARERLERAQAAWISACSALAGLRARHDATARLIGGATLASVSDVDPEEIRAAEQEEQRTRAERETALRAVDPTHGRTVV